MVPLGVLFVVICAVLSMVSNHDHIYFHPKIKACVHMIQLQYPSYCMSAFTEIIYKQCIMCWTFTGGWSMLLVWFGSVDGWLTQRDWMFCSFAWKAKPAFSRLVVIATGTAGKPAAPSQQFARSTQYVLKAECLISQSLHHICSAAAAYL